MPDETRPLPGELISTEESQPESAPAQRKAAASLDFGLNMAIGLALIVAICVIYAQTASFGFTNFDDTHYVTKNAAVQEGLSLASIRWAFTAVVAANWMPVTLLTHMLDCQLFLLDPGLHHLMNVVYHVLAALLLFLALHRATHARWPSAFVAFLFAAHPLHVESVAWIAERKDVLSACFWFLALYAYVRYVERPTLRGYLLVAASFALGLMAKPTLVTFPFTLLLFDIWPLRRLQSWNRSQWRKLLWEKLPLFALSGAASAVTFLVQRSTGAVKSAPLFLRIENALVSYAAYIGQMLWPAGLAPIYPFPPSVPLWKALGALALICILTMLAIRMWRTRPYFATGWFWYLGTLVPMIGLVQVGHQARADRYTYIPLTGLFIMLAWGAAELLESLPGLKPVMVAAAGIVCLACIASAWKQTGYWQDTQTLFEHAIEVTPNNWQAQYQLGSALSEADRHLDAIAYYRETIRLNPEFTDAYNNLGVALMRIPGREAEAIANVETAVRLNPKLAQAHRNLGLLYSVNPARIGEAIAELETSQRLQPDPVTAKVLQDLRTRGK